MAYLDATINHLRAVKDWASKHGGEVTLDLLNFKLEVKARNRFFSLYPQFISVVEGQRAHTPALTSDAIGFIGWLPYRPVRWPMSSDKLLFKNRIAELGLRTPAMWSCAGEASQHYILKASVGSFGNDLAGPYRFGMLPDTAALQRLGRRVGGARVYVEQFVAGRNIKAWYWGNQIFHLELDAYAQVVGNGHHCIAELLEKKLLSVASSMAQYREMAMIEQALAFQGLQLTDILEEGRAAWLDFRYGRRFTQEKNHLDTNCLPTLDAALKKQLYHAGALLAEDLMRQWHAPVLFSLDGVLDDLGQIWWLEMNSNPIFAPTGYPTMFATLFGTSGAYSAGTSAETLNAVQVDISTDSLDDSVVATPAVGSKGSLASAVGAVGSVGSDATPGCRTGRGAKGKTQVEAA